MQIKASGGHFSAGMIARSLKLCSDVAGDFTVNNLVVLCMTLLLNDLVWALK